MNIGEVGNFLSYAYAPASLVAPLGAVSLSHRLVQLISHTRPGRLDLKLFLRPNYLA